MFDSLMGLSSNMGLLVGGGSAGIVLFVLKKIPNERIYGSVETLFYACGKAMTLGLSSWSFTKGLWNKTIEPWFIDLFENTVGAAINGFLKGLRSD